MFQTILVPTDGSEHAEKAVELATDIAEKYDAKVVFLYVVPGGPVSEDLLRMAEVEHVSISGASGAAQTIAGIPQGRFPANMLGRDDEAAREVHEFVGQQALRRAESMARKKGATATETFMPSGNPAEVILDYADKQRANLIVMGSRGLSDLKGLLMGSVSHKVSHLAPCTCVTVR